ncbi:hypothetical protein HanXRQr2_Chr01g0020581 [Helianthus annuus]|uniref:Uncharacterized protein n=1 Tax=Helianthus annuus TaxID=4232 RepID=A0A9K3P3E2_HELAN|nr:hypothetical protein HanXRQr2_Chr01g0020581 [Helianthus annuus]KAJ0956817.1 hypothetical protein HanPSC8_Chr01g0019951 [Helianthus annuus]
MGAREFGLNQVQTYGFSRVQNRFYDYQLQDGFDFQTGLVVGLNVRRLFLVALHKNRSSQHAHVFLYNLLQLI